MAKTLYQRTSLIGGGADALDEEDGANLVDGDFAFVMTSSNIAYIYILDADSGAAESSPDVIAPDTNPGSKRWILQGVGFGSTSTGSLIPKADFTYDLGSSTYRWANIYTADFHLKNDVGDWTIVEGEQDLFLMNNKTGKKFKMMMEEI